MGFSVHLDPTADHYGSAEQLFGNFRSSLSQDVSAPVIGATKWCIFRAPTPSNQPLSREYVIDVVRERAKRMRIDFGRNKDEGAIEARVDFLQFHWQDYSDKRYLQALNILSSLRDPTSHRHHPHRRHHHAHKHTLSGLSERTLKHALHMSSPPSDQSDPTAPSMTTTTTAAEYYPSPSSSYDSSPSSSYGGLPASVQLLATEQQQQAAIAAVAAAAAASSGATEGLMLDGVSMTPVTAANVAAAASAAATGASNGVDGALLMDGEEVRIGGIGLVNFDSTRVDEICASLGPGVILTNQVQFSLIDTRPLYGMAEVCRRHGLKLLTYGTLCGGFLSDKWLGVPEPNRYHEEPTLRDPLTPSQKKYLDIILSAWGTWSLFQQLLSVLRAIGDRHQGASIANVATRWVLDHDDFVGAVILGARLGVSDNTDDNLKVCGWRLTKEDQASIAAVLAKSNGKELIRTIGDCGAEYR
ncbi:hypothetical protein FRC18_009953 [Serendipita sp. 400]|nr:hypothetical protein FRC18_009953 [Serendipita sp. 400]